MNEIRKGIEASIKALKAAYPKVFNSKYPPLKVGIYKDLEQMTETEQQRLELRTALKFWCGNINYKRSLAKGGKRYDLQGNEAQDILESEQNGARGYIPVIMAQIKAAKKKANK